MQPPYQLSEVEEKEVLDLALSDLSEDEVLEKLQQFPDDKRRSVDSYLAKIFQPDSEK